MNGTEQRSHRTVTAALANTLESVAQGAAERIADLDRRLVNEGVVLRRMINDECTHRLKLADEQRAYVDRADKALDAKLEAFLRRGFWSRLNWLLRGR